MALYTTHRPTQFKDLIGQSTPSRLLQQALIKNRVVNSYIFTGPRGTGKTSSARIFARATTCEKPHLGLKNESYEPCNNCNSCVSILNGSSADYIEIDAASNRGIEDSRGIKESAQYHPIQLKKKIFVIDEVHMLTTEAFNALLKLLEEPPQHTIFILATTELEKIPLTVRSRCQLVRFVAGTELDIEKKLEIIIEKEKINAEKGVANLIAKHAKGGYRDAETILESLHIQEQKLTLSFVSEKLGIIDGDLLNNIYSGFIEGNYLAIKDCIKKLPEDAGFYEGLIYQLINKTREEIINNGSNNKLTHALNQLLEAYLLTKGSPISSLPLEIACLNMAQDNTKQHKTTSLSSPPKLNTHLLSEDSTENEECTAKNNNQIQSLKIKASDYIAEKVQVIEISDQENCTNMEDNEQNNPIPDIRKIWKNMIQDLSTQNPALSQLLKETNIHTANHNTIQLNIRFAFHAEKIKEKKTQNIIQKILKDKTGRNWIIQYNINKATPRPTTHKAIQSPQNKNKTASTQENNDIAQEVSTVFSISA